VKIAKANPFGRQIKASDRAASPRTAIFFPIALPAISDVARYLSRVICLPVNAGQITIHDQELPH
jgi:hypothetical protein